MEISALTLALALSIYDNIPVDPSFTPDRYKVGFKGVLNYMGMFA